MSFLPLKLIISICLVFPVLAYLFNRVLVTEIIRDIRILRIFHYVSLTDWASTKMEKETSSKVYNNRMGLDLENVKNILETDLLRYTMMDIVLDFKMISKNAKITIKGLKW